MTDSLLAATTLTDAQLVAIMLVIYFAVYPVLTWMHPAQTGSLTYRSPNWLRLWPWLTWYWGTRVMLSIVGVTAAFLWTWVR